MTNPDEAPGLTRHKVAVIANMEKIGEQAAGALRDSLGSHGVTDLDWVEIPQGADAGRSAAGAVERGADTVVVCGGDGSVRLATEALVGTGVAMGVAPEGTGNGFVAALGLPTDTDDIAASVAAGGRQVIDTGICNGNVFNLTAGSGFDVGMMSPSDEEKAKLGLLAYFRAAMTEVMRRRPFHVAVTIDGKRFYDGPSSGVLVGRLGSQIGAIKTFPDASPTDGVLHVAVVSAVGPWQWLGLLGRALVGTQEESPRVEVGQGAKVLALFHRKRRFELDGDVLGRATKLDCRVDPRSLVICRPQA